MDVDCEVQEMSKSQTTITRLSARLICAVFASSIIYAPPCRANFLTTMMSFCKTKSPLSGTDPITGSQRSWQGHGPKESFSSGYYNAKYTTQIDKALVLEVDVGLMDYRYSESGKQFVNTLSVTLSPKSPKQIESLLATIKDMQTKAQGEHGPRIQRAIQSNRDVAWARNLAQRDAIIHYGGEVSQGYGSRFPAYEPPGNAEFWRENMHVRLTPESITISFSGRSKLSRDFFDLLMKTFDVGMPANHPLPQADLYAWDGN